MRKLENLQCPMRDGCQLATDVCLPDEPQKYPIILMRTPYGKGHLPTDPLYEQFTRLVADGYGVAVQDMRGTGLSQGTLGLNGHHEHEDGFDAVTWLADCDFCDGRVGMFGLSYPGFTQTSAAAYHPAALKAICPFMSPSQNPFGARQTMTLHMTHLHWAYSQLLENPEHYLPDPAFREQVLPILKENDRHLDDLLMALPLNQCKAVQIQGISMFEDYRELVAGIEDPAFWEKMRMPIDYDNVHTAAFYGTGWLDAAREWTITGYRGARASADETTREQARLLIGPWPHDGHLPRQVEDTDFGPEASGDAQDVLGMMHRWFDRHLRGKNVEPFADRVRYFMLGSNTWHTAGDWPPPEARMLSLYLGADGRLSKENAVAGNLAYAYDPMQPTPSGIKDASGHVLTADWQAVGRRKDVLRFATPPLTEELHVAGAVTLHLRGVTDAEDTDFACRLLDAAPDGTELSLAAGLVRAKYRAGFMKKDFITPNQPVDYTIEAGNTANCFRAGHSIAIQIASALYPDHDRNLNTRTPSNIGTECVTAHQTILCGIEASRLELPVLPE